MMDLRPLGNTGINVSPLGLGTVKFGRNEQVRYPLPFQLPERRQLVELLAAARASGINLLDTAPAYGSSEERLGELISGQRSDRVICTKVGEEFSDGQSHHDFSPAAVRRSVERSLRRLRTDVLDIVLLHSDGDDRHVLAASGGLEALQELKRAGKVRSVGVSHKSAAGARLALESCDLIMATLNLDYPDEREIIREAGERDIGVLVKKVFSSGHAALDARLRHDSLALALTSPGVSSVVLGTIDATHLAQNVASAESILTPAAFGNPR